MIYLDNAATSWPKPSGVGRTMAEALARCGNPGRSGHRMSLDGGKIILGCREALAQILHVSDPFSVIFTLSCTDSLNLAIKGLLPQGGHVVTTCVEHNSVLRPLGTLRQRGLVTFDVAPMNEEGQVTASAIAPLLKKDTRLVVVSHASNVTGMIQPVEEIIALCHDRGIPVVVDGAQSAGHIPLNLDALGADAYACSGHKGLLGPQGVGILVLSPTCRPLSLREGGTGSASLELTQPQELPDRYECGTAATPSIAGLWAAIEFLERFESVLHAQEQRLRQQLITGLLPIKGLNLLTSSDPAMHAVGVVSFTLDGIDSSPAADYLESHYDIACRPGLHCAPLLHKILGTEVNGAIRFSVGAFTTEREIQKAISAVEALAASRGAES
jgi:cysteine desulfurase family protein